jgi:hypothetical protein
LPRTRGRRTLEATDVIVNVLPDMHQFLPTTTSWHYAKLSIAQFSLEVLVEGVEAQVDRVPHDDGLPIRGHHHTRPSLSEFTPSATS